MAGFHDITAAIIGAGFIGPVHVEGLRRLGVRVKGIAGISADEATARGREPRPAPRLSRASRRCSPTPRSRASTSPRPTACTTITCSPRSTAGKHVVCEKPLAMTSAQTARARGRRQGASRARLPRSTTTCASIRCRSRRGRWSASGAVGDVLHVHGSYVQDWLLHPTDFNWRVLPVGRRRAAGGRRHRHALARPRHLRHRPRGRSRHGRPQDGARRRGSSRRADRSRPSRASRARSPSSASRSPSTPRTTAPSCCASRAARAACSRSRR